MKPCGSMDADPGSAGATTLSFSNTPDSICALIARTRAKPTAQRRCSRRPSMPARVWRAFDSNTAGSCWARIVLNPPRANSAARFNWSRETRRPGRDRRSARLLPTCDSPRPYQQDRRRESEGTRERWSSEPTLDPPSAPPSASQQTLAFSATLFRAGPCPRDHPCRQRYATPPTSQQEISERCATHLDTLPPTRVTCAWFRFDLFQLVLVEGSG